MVRPASKYKKIFNLMLLKPLIKSIEVGKRNPIYVLVLRGRSYMRIIEINSSSKRTLYEL